MNKPTIFFDMDGTIADLYGVPNWLTYLQNESAFPYETAKPLINLSALARRLNTLAKKGYKIGIISWLAKCGGDEYETAVAAAKIKWLKKHLPSVHFDTISIVSYGTPKEKFAMTEYDILFDDEKRNRDNWIGTAYDVDRILETLKTF